MKKIIIKSIAVLAALIVALFLIAILTIWHDEASRPQVSQVVEWKVPAGALADNGYLILLGMDAPADQDAAEAGRKILEADIKRFQKVRQGHQLDAASHADSSSIEIRKKFKKLYCDYQTQLNCVDFYVQQNPAGTVLIDGQPIFSERFEAIRQAKHYLEVLPPFADAQFPSYILLVNASELQRMQAVLDINNGKLDKGLERFVENAQFSRYLLRNSNSLISHMIALTMVTRDVRILSELLVKYPKIANQSETLSPMLATIATPDYSMRKALEFERVFLMQTIISASNEYALSTQSAELKTLASRVPNPFFLPNATLNLQYDILGYTLAASDVPAHQLDQYLLESGKKKSSLMGWGYDNFYLKNPVGKILINVGDTSYGSYLPRHWDVEGAIRLASLQLKIIAEHIPDEKISAAVQSAAPAFLNPYDLKPMDWNPRDHTISFRGRQPSNQYVNKSKVFIAKIPEWIELLSSQLIPAINRDQ